jgi:tetratricopeptide (TPR) repeat protein
LAIAGALLHSDHVTAASAGLARRPRQTPWLDLIVVSAVALVAYSNALDGPFVFDDVTGIVENRHVRVYELSFDALAAAVVENRSTRPLASLSFALNHAFGGYAVRSYHVVNIAIHLATAWVVVLLATSLFRRLWPGETGRVRGLALLAALVFVAHPIQTQAVTYVVQRMTSMATLFYLLAVLAYLEARSAERNRRWAWWAACGATGLLAFGAKQIAVTLPFALLLVEWHFFRDAGWSWLRERAWALMGLFGLLAAGAAVYLAGFDAPMPSYAEQGFTMAERLLTQLRVVVFYIGLLVFPDPSRLNLLHAFPTSHSLLDPPSTLLAGALLLALLTLAFALRRRERLLSFAILWFFLHLLLESTVLPLALVFEHRLYLPMFGCALLAADVIWRIAGGRRWAVVVAGTALIGALASATFVRNAVWGDAVSFWTDVVSKSPLEDRAHYNLALAYEAIGSIEQAERAHEQVLRLNPSYADAVNALGMIYEGRGEFDRALDRYQAAARMDPTIAVYPTNRALLQARRGQLDPAAKALEDVVASHPEHAEGHYALGHIRELTDRLEDAAQCYERAVALESDHVDAHLRLAILLAVQGKAAEALDHARIVTRLAPERQEAQSLVAALRRARGER